MPNVSYELLDEQMNNRDKKFYEQMGNRIASLRKEQQLTQVQLSKTLGISQQLMAAYEAGQRKVPSAMLPRLATSLDVAVEEILGMSKLKTKRGPAPKLQRQIEQIRLLPRSKQRFVMEMLETVIKQQARQS